MTRHLDDDAAVYVISVAAELAGMHPQTLRQYDRLGIVTPRRTAGRGRRYSPRDVDALRQVQRLSQQEGINLAGIRRIIELERELVRAHDELGRLRATAARVFAADATGEVSELPRGARPRRRSGGALVVWRPPYRG